MLFYIDMDSKANKVLIMSAVVTQHHFTLPQRQRSRVLPFVEAPDDNIKYLVDSLRRKCENPTEMNGTLTTLVGLTGWQTQNQASLRQIAHQNNH